MKRTIFLIAGTLALVILGTIIAVGFNPAAFAALVRVNSANVSPINQAKQIAEPTCHADSDVINKRAIYLSCTYGMEHQKALEDADLSEYWLEKTGIEAIDGIGRVSVLQATPQDLFKLAEIHRILGLKPIDTSEYR